MLWLNEFHDFDIRCVRLSPYSSKTRLLLDVQHVIPLPEASSYTVRVREKENAVKQARESGADWTKFIIETPQGATQPLAKRWAMLRLVEGLAKAGVPMHRIRAVLPDSKTLQVDGVHTDPDDLWGAVQTQFGKPGENRRRWHLADPIVEGDKTWVLNNNWGDKTRDFFKALLAQAPDGFGVTEEGDVPKSLG